MVSVLDNIKKQPYDYLCYAGVILVLAAKHLKIMGDFYEPVYVIGILMLVAKIMLDTRILETNRILVILISVALFFSMIAFKHEYFYAVLMVLAADHTDYRRVAATVGGIFSIKFISSILIAWISGTLMKPMEEFEAFADMYGGNRYALGMGHANAAGSVFVFMVICYVIYRLDKIMVPEIAGIAVLNAVIYNYTKCMTMNVVVLLVVAGLLFKKLILDIICKKDGFELWRGIITLLVPLAVILVEAVSVIFPIMYEFDNANKGRYGSAFSRFVLSREAFRRYDVKLLGQHIERYADFGAEYFVIDNSYVMMLLRSGLIVSILVMIILLCIAWTIKGNYILSVLYVGMLLNCTMEGNLDSLLVIFGTVLLSNMGPVLQNTAKARNYQCNEHTEAYTETK